MTYKGRQAIELAFESLRLEPESSVGVTGFTCIAVIDSIEKQNLKPVYLDIDPKTLNFTATTLEQKLKKEKLKAVIIQNTLGYPCDIENIQAVCKKHKIILIEDLAHSIGTVYANGKEAGTVGDFTILSFSQDKVVDAVSGGAVISRKYKVLSSKYESQTSLQDRMYPLLTSLIRKTYPVGLGKVLHLVFLNFKLLSDPMKSSKDQGMSNWHAGLALDDFKKIDKNLSHRRKIARIYANNIKSELLSREICATIDSATNLRFPLFVENRDKLVQHLKKKGIYISDIWYDSPVAPKKYLGLARYPKASCPNAEEVSDKILNLPTHINVSKDDALKVCELINEWLQ